MAIKGRILIILVSCLIRWCYCDNLGSFPGAGGSVVSTNNGQNHESISQQSEQQQQQNEAASQKQQEKANEPQVSSTVEIVVEASQLGSSNFVESTLTPKTQSVGQDSDNQDNRNSSHDSNTKESAPNENPVHSRPEKKTVDNPVSSENKKKSHVVGKDKPHMLAEEHKKATKGSSEAGEEQSEKSHPPEMVEPLKDSLESQTKSVSETETLKPVNSQNTKVEAEPSPTHESGEERAAPSSEVMPSFDEWKKIRLAEQEKGGQKVPAVPGAQPKKPSHKSRRNYASYECGAKLVAANPEADSPGRVLNEQMDEYMLNPCKAKIWFVIELCESIQINQIDLANFELFSSMPKDFAISWSDRYPSREWTSLGTFTALDQKAIQSFNLDSPGFGKYLKIELLSNYGSEHYCPLSIVRAYGTSMVDDYDQLDEEPQDVAQPIVDEDEEDRLDKIPINKGESGSKNVVARARDVVISILKNAAQVLSREQADGMGNEHGDGLIGTSVSPCSELDPNCSIVNVSGDTQNKSSFPSCLYPAFDSLAPVFQQCTLCSSSPLVDDFSTHIEAIPTCRFMQAALGPKMYTRLCSSYQDKVADSTEHEKDDERPPEKPKISKPSSTIKVIVKPTTSVSNDEIKRGTKKVTKQGDSKSTTSSSRVVTKPHKDIPVVTPGIMSTRRVTSSDISVTKPVSQVGTENSETVPMMPIQSSRNEERDSVTLKGHKEATETLKSAELSHTAEDPKLFGSIGTQEHSSGSQAATPPVSVQTSDVETSPASTQPVESASTTTASVQSTETEETLSTSSISCSQSGESKCTATDDTVVSTTEQEPETAQEVTPPSKETLPSKDGPKVEGLKHVPPPEPAITSASQKESVFMRINNRIKGLELNMSLSSQYLEELSKRYRKQMEDMQRAFNRTIGTLNDTARKAAEKDQRQQEALVQLQTQLSNITEMVDLLLTERKSLNKQLLESHICLIVIEVIIFATIFSLCLRRMQQGSFENGANVNKVNEVTTSSVPRTPIKRRNSVGGPELRLSPVAEKKKRPSEECLLAETPPNLLIVEPAIPIMVEPPPKEKAKKNHKNKKNKGLRRRASLSNLNSTSDCKTSPKVAVDDNHYISSAGVLLTNTPTKSSHANCVNGMGAQSKTTATVIEENWPRPLVESVNNEQTKCFMPLKKVVSKNNSQKWNFSCGDKEKLGLAKHFRIQGKTPV